ncbi:50S ribosomal protein L7/L12 [Candidatus Fokinia crypta]|uniref:Large ribosomal subunit protein bL12 n=1 Tax=Candidatus Fokinia crypta TaxID=1920990 RepID=A0ABZ0UTE5_9RICK|nr:50S ribosomal protein L7/L12 [Candidatus Fokinia cryptica]WPX97963.1 50S ribosomal protein L7/L12 [Candidatus Fokinia cryptica]
MKNDLIKTLSELSVAEIAALVKELEEAWGVSAAAPVAAIAQVAAPAAESQEKTAFDVIITAIDPNKRMDAMKAIKEVGALEGLVAAKAIADELSSGGAKVLKSEVTKQEAEGFANTLKAAGCTVEIK